MDSVPPKRTCDCTTETLDSYERLSVDDTPFFDCEAKRWNQGNLSSIDTSGGCRPYCVECGKDGKAHYVTRPSGGWYYCKKCTNNIIADEKWNFCRGTPDVSIYHRPKAICKVKRAE